MLKDNAHSRLEFEEILTFNNIRTDSHFQRLGSGTTRTPVSFIKSSNTLGEIYHRINCISYVIKIYVYIEK